MKHIDASSVRYTSLTIRSSCRQRIKEAVAFLKQQGLDLSEQRLMRECLRLALRFWRGTKDIAARNKRYNKRKGGYEIVPFYSTESLRSVCWARCHHSGISLSRLMDFSIANYLPRVIESWLGFYKIRGGVAEMNEWRRKYHARKKTDGFLISYYSQTTNNNMLLLSYTEKSEILPWPPTKKYELPLKLLT